MSVKFMSRIDYSKTDAVARITYPTPDVGQYYGVSFYDTGDKSLNICASSQVGCVERCSFCATGDQGFKRNLSPTEVSKQFLDGVHVFDSLRVEKGIEQLYIIMEGMGEPSYNIENILIALTSVIEDLERMFARITFRISTVGNVDMVDPYIRFIEAFAKFHEKLTFQFQLSLHTAIDAERAIMIPSRSGRKSLSVILKELYRLADFLNAKLKCNYLLLDFPDGGNNYDVAHLDAMKRRLDPCKTRIKLTKYSETGKNFRSPVPEEYERVRADLELAGFEVKIRRIVGADVMAACGMQHYDEDGHNLVRLRKK